MTNHTDIHAAPDLTDPPNTPESCDRRSLFRSLFRNTAAMAIGGMTGSAAVAQQTNTPVSDSVSTVDTSRLLQEQTQRAMRWAGNDPANWVRARPGVDHNVVIVGAGHSGMAIGYGLRRKGVGGVQLIDMAAANEAGIWRGIARMKQLRTPKTLPGPESGNPALSFRAWFETLNGPQAFDSLDRIPRLAWADYLTWFQQVTKPQVRYRTRLIDIEPAGDLLRLHLESDGQKRVETTRKLVLATGYAGAGGPSVPDFLQALPSRVWTHSTGAIPVDGLKGKIVAVIGAGSNAFDAAGVALEAGAAEVHMFDRRAYIDYQNPTNVPAPPATPMDRGYPVPLEFAYELPDVMRWRNFLVGERRPATVPYDSMQRALAFKNFHIHLSTSLSDVAMAGNRISAKAGTQTMRFDYLISGTGYRVDLGAQPELQRIHESIALWRDRYQPAAGEDNAAGAAYPYLGAGFEFLPRNSAGNSPGGSSGTASGPTSGEEYLRNIHCFNIAALVSFGILVGDVPSMVYHPRIVAAIARDLYTDSLNMEAHQKYFNAPSVAPDPAPYQHAVAGNVRPAA